MQMIPLNYAICLVIFFLSYQVFSRLHSLFEIYCFCRERKIDFYKMINLNKNIPADKYMHEQFLLLLNNECFTRATNIKISILSIVDSILLVIITYKFFL